MEIFVSGADSVKGILFFDINGAYGLNTIMGRVSSDGIVDSGHRLVTGFTTGEIVPEPTSLILPGTGLGGTAPGAYRRGKAQVVSAK